MSDPSVSGPVGPAVLRMASRDAAAQLVRPLRAPWVDAPRISVFVRVRRCPRCGVDEIRAAAQALAPIREVQVLPPHRQPPRDAIVVEALGCEALTARSLLLLAWAEEAGVELPSRVFSTRSAAWFASAREDACDDHKAGVIALDTRETWADDLLRQQGSTGVTPPYVLPACTRLNNATSARAGLAPHFVSPHLRTREMDHLNHQYLRWRGHTVANALDRSPLS